MIESRESCTFFSFYRSRAEVASSRRSILGFLRIVLAIATLCFCPPEICDPLTPTFLSNPVPLLVSLLVFSFPKIKVVALALLAAS